MINIYLEARRTSMPPLFVFLTGVSERTMSAGRPVGQTSWTT